jgi:hypothetical protein
MSRATGTPGRLAMPRRRGAATGLLITLAGIWCAAIPFVGHYLNFVVGPDTAFDMTAGRFWLSLVPGVVAIIGGLMLLRSANRATATLGAQLALAAGVWLVIGRELSQLWTSAWSEGPAGGPDRQALELLLYFYATGALITALAGVALGRVSARHAGDLERLAPAEERTTNGRFGRREPAAEPVTRREAEAEAETTPPAASSR